MSSVIPSLKGGNRPGLVYTPWATSCSSSRHNVQKLLSNDRSYYNMKPLAGTALTTSPRHCQGFSLSKLHCKWSCEKSCKCDCQVISSSLLQGISTCRQWKKKLTPVRMKDWPVYWTAGTSVDAVGPIWSQLQKQKQKEAHLQQVTEDLRADRCCPIKISVPCNFLRAWILFRNDSSQLHFTFWG